MSPAQLTAAVAAVMAAAGGDLLLWVRHNDSLYAAGFILTTMGIAGFVFAFLETGVPLALVKRANYELLQRVRRFRRTGDN